MKKLKKYILLDFDDVIFDSWKLGAALIKIFKTDQKNYNQAYQELFRIKGKLVPYDPIKHFKKIKNPNKKEVEKMRVTIKNFLNDTGKFVFKDALDFLEKNKNLDLYLVTFGLKNFQAEKINSSGIRKFFKKIIILKTWKSEAVKIIFSGRLIRNEVIYFFDDSIRFLEEMKKKYPRVKTVLVKRRKKPDQVKNKYCDYEIKNFSEAAEIINNETAEE
ncbi:MAG: HAD hydrolase-like protein [bacterium]|nr:HAD hydrolase-like protein [bacterium]